MFFVGARERLTWSCILAKIKLGNRHMFHVVDVSCAYDVSTVAGAGGVRRCRYGSATCRLALNDLRIMHTRVEAPRL